MNAGRIKRVSTVGHPFDAAINTDLSLSPAFRVQRGVQVRLPQGKSGENQKITFSPIIMQNRIKCRLQIAKTISSKIQIVKLLLVELVKSIQAVT